MLRIDLGQHWDGVVGVADKATDVVLRVVLSHTVVANVIVAAFCGWHVKDVLVASFFFAVVTRVLVKGILCRL